jgi:phosphoglycolate phosphatase
MTLKKTENRRYDTVIFDLDGTLLDTLQDLTDSVNAVLAAHDMMQYTCEQVRGFVGNGIRRLLQLAVPGGEECRIFEQIYEEFMAYYGAHCMDHTEPYPGIPGLLDWLSKEGYRCAIVSNKADFAVKKLNRIYFGELVPVAIGEREGCRRKPYPDSVWQAIEELEAERTRAVYIGDSEVDLLTARNAGVACIAVSWGFRERSFLLEQGQPGMRIASNVNELKVLLQQNA